MNSVQNCSDVAPGLSRSARNSLLCGIVMLAGWIMPLLAIPLGIAGLITGVTGLPSARRDLARAGIFLNGLGLALTSLNIFLAYYFFITGKLEQLFVL